ncbi:hypothetical protein HKX48_002135 [Thoreauomyces humboldtii]|nr:hypothetical protein HKX48_002135 [Thoreauomyces humboldtii]
MSILSDGTLGYGPNVTTNGIAPGVFALTDISNFIPTTDVYNTSATSVTAAWVAPEDGVFFPLKWPICLETATPGVEPIAVGTMSVSVATISTYLANINISPNSVVSIWDMTGTMVAASPANVSQIFESTERYIASGNLNPFISETAAFIYKQYPDLSKMPDLFTGSFKASSKIGGGVIFVGAATIVDQYGLEWIVVLSMPKDDFAGNLYQIQKTVVGAIVDTAVRMVLIVAGMARVLAAPIKILTANPSEIVIQKQVFHTMLLKFSDAIQKKKSFVTGQSSVGASSVGGDASRKATMTPQVTKIAATKINDALV